MSASQRKDRISGVAELFGHLNRSKNLPLRPVFCMNYSLSETKIPSGPRTT